MNPYHSIDKYTTTYPYPTYKNTTENCRKNTPPQKEECIYGSSLEIALQSEQNRQLFEETYSKSISYRFHMGIRKGHKIVKKNEVFQKLIKGGKEVCPDFIVGYFCNLYLIYKELEEAQKKIIQKYGKECFVFPVLHNSSRLLDMIKIWSPFSLGSSLFADRESNAEEFIQDVRNTAEKSTHVYVSHIKELAEKNSLELFGIIYSFYGFKLSGEHLKMGLKSGFEYRLNLRKCPVESQLFLEIEKKINEVSTYKADLLEECVSFWNFPKENFSISAFKQEWNKNLDELPKKLSLSENELEPFIEGCVHEAVLGIKYVMDLINFMAV